jgi:hypothetical protein
MKLLKKHLRALNNTTLADFGKPNVARKKRRRIDKYLRSSIRPRCLLCR